MTDSLAQAKTLRDNVLEQVQGRLFGMDAVIDSCLIGIATGGHILLQGVPGLGKTALVNCLAQLFDLQFSRVQFTPDLMPADITGSEVLDIDPESGQKIFRFLQGPIFTNLLLADEINRTPPRTQAALLEAMQERSVTIGQTTHQLPKPFVVFATMNPVEQEGTYILPEAELDRFLMQVRLVYPTSADEAHIATARGADPADGLQCVATAEQLFALQQTVSEVDVPQELVDVIVRLVRATRTGEGPAADIRFGAGPRASQSLVRCVAAYAALRGRPLASTEDLVAVIKPVLRHRIHLSFDAISRKVDVDQLLDQLLQTEL